MRATAVLEIHNAPRLTELQALKLARLIGTAHRTLNAGRFQVGKATAFLSYGRRPSSMRELGEWLELQGCSLVVDRHEYADTYRAKLYA